MDTRNHTAPLSSLPPRLPRLLSVIQDAMDQRRQGRPTLSLAATIRLQRESPPPFTTISQEKSCKIKAPWTSLPRNPSIPCQKNPPKTRSLPAAARTASVTGARAAVVTTTTPFWPWLSGTSARCFAVIPS